MPSFFVIWVGTSKKAGLLIYLAWAFLICENTSLTRGKCYGITLNSI